MDTRLYLERGIKYLAKLEFKEICEVEEYLDEDCTQINRTLQLLFPSAFVLHAISHVSGSDPKVDDLQKQLVVKIKAEASENNTFNYWLRDSNEFTNSPLPDDVDDTACALSALQVAGIEPRETAFLATMKLQVGKGGPYTSWYTHLQQPIWRDVDPIVNAHFLYLCALNDIHPEGAVQYLLKTLEENKVSSPYYPYPLIGYLYLARFVSTSKVDVSELKEILWQKLQTIEFNNVKEIEKIFWALSCAYLGKKVSTDKLEQICALQKSNGSMPNLVICVGHWKKKKSTYIASSAATTALFVELLIRVRKNEKDKAGKVEEHKDSYSKYFPELTTAATKLQNHYRQALTVASPEIAKLIPPKLSRSTFFPLIAASSIEAAKHETSTELENLTVAMLSGWQAYHLLDNMLDEGLADSRLIVATSLLRTSDCFLEKIPSRIANQIRKASNYTDLHYLWEAKNLKFEKGQLKKSYKPKLNYRYIENRIKVLTTALSAIPLLYPKGKEPEKESKNELYQQKLQKIFTNIFVIDQLNDDLHDWQEDKNSGQLTWVLNLLAKAKQDYPKRSYQWLLWQNVFPEVMQLAEEVFLEAEDLIRQLPNPEPLKTMLELHISPLRKAQQELDSIENLQKFMKDTSALV